MLNRFLGPAFCPSHFGRSLPFTSSCWSLVPGLLQAGTLPVPCWSISQIAPGHADLLMCGLQGDYPGWLSAKWGRNPCGKHPLLSGFRGTVAAMTFLSLKSIERVTSDAFHQGENKRSLEVTIFGCLCQALKCLRMHWFFLYYYLFILFGLKILQVRTGDV